jgi:phospholipid transport system substrate-binding protein
MVVCVTRPSPLVVSLLALLSLLAAAPAHAGPPTERLISFFIEANRVIMAPDGEGGLEERVEAVRTLVNGVIDFEGAAALALGKHWEQRSAAERAEFTRLYADLLERAYMAWLGSKARVGSDGVSIRWLGETLDGEQATVRTTLLTRAGTEMPIDYKMVRRAAAWAVRDVVIDGLSLAANYHVQIERVIQTGSYAELVARLRDKAGPSRNDATALAAAAVRNARPSAALGPDVVDAARIIVEGAPAAELPAVAPAPRLAPAATVAQLTPTTAAPSTGAAPSAPSSPSAMAPPVAAVPLVPVSRPAASGESTMTVAPAAAPAKPVVVSTAKPTATPVAAVVSAPIATPGMPALMTPASAKTAVATTTSARTFWVQVGAFRSAAAAIRTVERLAPHSATIAVTRAALEPIARVLVGPFAERTAAASTLRDLEKRGFAAFIATE